MTTDSQGQAVFDVPFTSAGRPAHRHRHRHRPAGQHLRGLGPAPGHPRRRPTRVLGDRPGQPLIFSAASGDGIALQDPDAGPLDPAWDLTLSVTAGTLTLSSTAGLAGSGDGTGSLSYRGSLSALDAALASLTYTPAPGFQGSLVLGLTAGSEGASSLQSQVPMYVTDGLFVVTTTADSGPGSLRQAILDSNSTHRRRPTRSRFAIPGPGRADDRPALRPAGDHPAGADRRLLPAGLRRHAADRAQRQPGRRRLTG